MTCCDRQQACPVSLWEWTKVSRSHSFARSLKPGACVVRRQFHMLFRQAPIQTTGTRSYEPLMLTEVGLVKCSGDNNASKALHIVAQM